MKSYIESAAAGDPTTAKINADMNIESQIRLSANQDIVIDGQSHPSLKRNIN